MIRVLLAVAIAAVAGVPLAVFAQADPGGRGGAMMMGGAATPAASPPPSAVAFPGIEHARPRPFYEEPTFHLLVAVGSGVGTLVVYFSGLHRVYELATEPRTSVLADGPADIPSGASPLGRGAAERNHAIGR